MPNPRCPSCDYDLRGHDVSGVCPECGGVYEIEKQAVERWTAPRAGWMFLHLTLTALGLIYSVGISYAYLMETTEIPIPEAIHSGIWIWIVLCVLSGISLIVVSKELPDAPTSMKTIEMVLFLSSTIIAVIHTGVLFLS